MGLYNSQQKYGSLSKFFHWSIALAVFCMLALGYFHTQLRSSAPNISWMAIHKSLGISVLLLMVLRLVWRMGNAWPKMPRNVPTWETKIAHAVFYLFYLLIILMPITGWIMSTASKHTPNVWWIGTFAFPGIQANLQTAQLAKSIHNNLALVIMALIVLHTLGALKNHFFAKNELLKRMLPFYKEKKSINKSKTPLDDFLNQ